MRRVATWAVGLALAALATGVAVLPLETPAFTQALSMRYSLAAEAGLSRPRAVALAEQVRAFVVSGTGTLPASVEGRPAFDSAAVSHLRDVARVLAGARVATVVLALALGVFLGLALARRRYGDIASALKAGAVLSAALPLLAIAVGAVDFDSLFSAFHGLFFAAGTWTFPYDSLLIRLFPEPFWTSAGVAWGMAMVFVGVLFGMSGLIVARRLSIAPARTTHGSPHNPS